MIYIKDFGSYVELAGQVANERMLTDGYFEYHGEIPQGTIFKLVEGNLICIDIPKIKPVLSGIDISNFIRQGFGSKSYQERKTVMKATDVSFRLLEYNLAVTESDFEDIILDLKGDIGDLLPKEEIEGLVLAVRDFATNYRFQGV